MADLIKKTDTLNQGREKLNEAITDAETAKIVSEQADDKASQALAKSESTQTQLDTIVIDGDSSVEAAQARVSTTGTAYGTLKQRLDTEYEEVTSQLALTLKEEDFNKVIYNPKEPLQLTKLPTFANGINNCAPFTQDNATTDGFNQYAVWVDDNSKVWVGRRTAFKGNWVFTNISD